jgi:16S rRNA (cytosine1402-N4)-methyltransferase
MLDATFGGGGYARALLASADITLIGLDRDPDAIARAQVLAASEPRLLPVPGRFGDLDTHAGEAGHARLDGVVMDLGVSSFQLDEGERGFSFMRDGPLDMRMGADGFSAADLIVHASEAELAAILYHLGEERESRRIARAIKAALKDGPITRTSVLADLIETALGGRRGARTHPATKSFQALRLFVNDELGELARALEAAERVLVPGGRLVVVTFHSLEDRLVKDFLRERGGLEGVGSRHMPANAPTRASSFEVITRKSVSPSETELALNPRARSARLRAARRTQAPAWGRAVALPGMAGLPSRERLERAA